jgi:hypothetical protein
MNTYPQSMRRNDGILRKACQIGFIHRVVRTARRHFDSLVRQDVSTDRGVEREAMGSFAGAEYKHRRRTIQDVTGSHLPGAALQYVGERFTVERAVCVAPQDREDRAHAHIHVDITGTIQRSEDRRTCHIRGLAATVGSSFSSDAKMPTLPRLPKQESNV